jgi:uncharacterized protein YbjT (DUF2867 family)
MKIIVIGGTGLIGSKLVQQLRARSYEAVAAAPSTGVNTLTGEGLAEVLNNATVVVDVSDAPSYEEKAVMEFFHTSTKNLLSREAKAGVRHHVALSVVGSTRMSDNPYIRAKLAQQQLIQESGIPYTIVHATQFFEFAMRIADGATVGKQVRVPPVLIQPIAADDVAKELARVAIGAPLNTTIEVAGPQRLQFADFIRQRLRAQHDSREVVADPDARYFGAQLSELALVAAGNATLGEIRLEDWLSPAVSAR